MILSLIIWSIAVALYAISQLIMHKKLRWLKENGTGFWDGKSDLRKYKNLDSSQGPKFRYSTTLLVGLTDGYHALQFIFTILFCISAVSYEREFGFWIDGGIYWGVWHLSFWMVYNGFQRKGK